MSYYPNTKLDHLNPNNWWPAYHAETDRRAIPAAALMTLDADLNAYALFGSEDDPWWHPIDADQNVSNRAVILEGRGTGPQEVAPDYLVYIAQRDFEELRTDLPAALQRAFDDLWAYHQAGRCSRLDFDRRAASLRQLRDIITNNEGVFTS